MSRDPIENVLSRRLGGSEFPGIVSAYLFGSESEGRPHRESDVDVGVLLSRSAHPTARDRFDQRLLLASRLAATLRGRPVDVVILNDAPPGIARRIVIAGTRLVCGDPAADHAFVRDVQLRAADLEPFLRRMRRIKLRVITRP